MWTGEECGRCFVNRNQWHSYTVLRPDDLLVTAMAFGGVTLRKRFVDAASTLEDWVDDLRFRRIEAYGPGSFGHTVRLTCAAGLDSLPAAAPDRASIGDIELTARPNRAGTGGMLQLGVEPPGAAST